MKNPNLYSIHPQHLQRAKALQRAKTPDASETPTPPPTASTIRTVGREYVNPVDYQHPFDSMARFAQALALRYDANRTRHAYDLFFTAVAGALSEKLADKGLRAAISGFTAMLHTWNQQLGFHPQNVTFRWKNRDCGNRLETSFVTSEEFVRRYLRHVLPRGLRSIRYYGFCHPAAKASRLRVQIHSGGPVQLGAADAPASPPPTTARCSRCHQPMRLVANVPSPYRVRGPPRPLSPFLSLRA